MFLHGCTRIASSFSSGSLALKSSDGCDVRSHSICFNVTKVVSCWLACCIYRWWIHNAWLLFFLKKICNYWYCYDIHARAIGFSIYEGVLIKTYTRAFPEVCNISRNNCGGSIVHFFYCKSYTRPTPVHSSLPTIIYLFSKPVNNEIWSSGSLLMISINTRMILGAGKGHSV